MDSRTDVAFADPLVDGVDLAGRWELITFGPVFTADAGTVRPTAEGLRVRSVGTNPATGDPAFEPAPNLGNHLKWVAQVDETSTAGFPGRDLSGEAVLTFRMTLGARVFGPQLHPFGSAVADPDADFRLGSGVMNVMDFETGIVLDFWVCNSAVYPFYERIPRPEPYASAHAFSSAFPPVPRTPEAVHDLAISVDGRTGVARWYVDGAEVASVARLGHPDPAAAVVLDHGGTDADAHVRQLRGGFGIMTLLDAALPPASTGLLDLGEHYDFPTGFTGGTDAFGQGVEILARDYRIDHSPAPALLAPTAG